jgi:hypothetical protein
VSDRVRVSVVLPFLNASQFLRECIDSVLAQTYTDWELILVDDGSSDDGIAIAREYVDRMPGRVRCLEHPGHENRGISASRNLGVRHARGEYIAELDADDVWLPDKLARLVPELEAHPEVGMVYGNSLWWYGWTGEPADAARDHLPVMDPTEGPADGAEVLLRQLGGKTASPCPCAVVLRKSLVEQVGGSEVQFRGTHEDIVLYAKLLLAAPVIVLDGWWDRYRCYSSPGSSVTEVAKQQGTLRETHQRYLRWLEGYLVAHGFAESPHRRLVHDSLRRLRYPRLQRAIEAGRPWRFAVALVACLATIAVVATYPVFSQMWDEPATLAAGMEWLSTGAYHYEAQHPPLARVASALLPYLRGARSLGNHGIYDEGRALLGEGVQYRSTLFLARLGMLPFFWLMLVACARWGGRIAGSAGAALAVLFVAANPNLLAHAAVAGTDLAPAAFVVAATYAWLRWREQPTTVRAMLAGLTIGLAATTKFSALAFLGLTLALGEAVRRLGTRRSGDPGATPLEWRSVLVAFGSAALAIWAVYRFHVGPMSPGGVPVPAPEFFAGLGAFFTHGSGGHPAFLLGEVRLRGWWYYYLVVLAVKTPLPLLALAIAGAVYALRASRTEGWTAVVPILGAIAVLVPALLSHVDLGVRIVLAIYPFLALLAARGATTAWRSAGTRAQVLVRRGAVSVLAAGTIVTAVRSWPDYLAYFNPAAGSHPERVLVDSNLDWGQDLYRLADTVRARGIDSIRVHYFGSSQLSSVGLTNARRLARDERTTGWVAASETFLAGVWSDTSLHWLARRPPVARIGPSMRLYYIPPNER